MKADKLFKQLNDAVSKEIEVPKLIRLQEDTIIQAGKYKFTGTKFGSLNYLSSDSKYQFSITVPLLEKLIKKGDIIII